VVWIFSITIPRSNQKVKSPGPILAEWPVGKAIAVSYLRGKNLEHKDITPTEGV